MALFTADSKNVFGQTVEEAGTYNVVVAPSSQFTNSKQTGKPMAVFDYEVVDGKYAGGQIRFDNEVWDGSTKEKADQSAKRFSTIAVALGAADGTAFDSVEQFVSQSIGHRLAVSVDWETGQNGKTYLVVRGYQTFMPDGSKPNGIKRPVDAQGGNNNGGFGSHASSNTGLGAPTTNQASGGFGAQNTAAGYNSGDKYHGEGFPPIPNNSPF
ncbi:DUF669 domain-containing protein [Lactiplantibacillus paraxiangfangensis]|uniref:DUF669 domain-containing protein n=1 Tax=Lactiplantibacillus paraxiangfangensis TaxID=3076224 RepID=UPI0030C76BA3